MYSFKIGHANYENRHKMPSIKYMKPKIYKSFDSWWFIVYLRSAKTDETLQN